MENPDYNDLLEKCKCGDAGARERLFYVLQVRLRSILKYRLRGWATDELDDILQDTLTVMAERLMLIESNPQLFALAILRNKIGSRLLRHRRRIHLTIDPTGSRGDDDTDNGPSDVAVIASPDDSSAEMQDNETADLLRRALRQLSPLCQTLFVALLENRSVAETWDLFRTTEVTLSRSTFDKRLFDCRRKLRQLTARSL
jgi:DNA-directed RNA polymerase specialized sigma24 family protein